ncbi:MAG: epoxyqueuosine reductase QueH [bacterium]
MNKKLLLHCCCAPCAIYVVTLLEKDYDLTLFFYNPNIHPEYEYNKRFRELENFVDMKKIKLLSGDYDVKNWLGKISGRENDPERGERCKICYEERLRRTAEHAKKNNFDFFGTTLTISPHKSALVINYLGLELQDQYGVNFVESDFKKKDGFKKSLELSRQYDFYRQNYCGCLFSQINNLRK